MKKYRYWGNRNGGPFGNKSEYVLRLTEGEEFAGYYYEHGEYMRIFGTWDVETIERFDYMELAGDPFVSAKKPAAPVQQCKKCGDTAAKLPQKSVRALIRRFVDWLLPEGYQDKKGFHYGKPVDKTKK